MRIYAIGNWLVRMYVKFIFVLGSEIDVAIIFARPSDSSTCIWQFYERLRSQSLQEEESGDPNTRSVRNSKHRNEILKNDLQKRIRRVSQFSSVVKAQVNG
jgi:hypothetical protein